MLFIYFYIYQIYIYKYKEGGVEGGDYILEGIMILLRVKKKINGRKYVGQFLFIVYKLQLYGKRKFN